MIKQNKRNRKWRWKKRVKAKRQCMALLECLGHTPVFFRREPAGRNAYQHAVNFARCMTCGLDVMRLDHGPIVGNGAITVCPSIQ